VAGLVNGVGEVDGVDGELFYILSIQC
jgi:hypothetical protein